MTARAGPLEHPAWPALMPIDTARAYLGDLSEASFRFVTKMRGVAPVDLGIAVTRWRKADLDAMIDRLALRGSPLSAETLLQPDPFDLAMERAERRLRR